MKLSGALTGARAVLWEKGIDDADLEGEILLRHVLEISRAYLFSHFDAEISPKQETIFHQALARRLAGEPTAYITGHREFYGLDFIVSRDVLIPRPESELLVEKTIALAGNRPVSGIADIGTGSGAIAVSLAVNLPGVTVYACDVSTKALEIAEQNCRKHGVADRVILRHGDMLEPLPGKVDIIVANLPYVQASDIPTAGPLSYEPNLALDGGRDGLDAIRDICRQAGGKLNSPGCLLLEVGQGQASGVGAILQKELTSGVIEIYRDLAGIERVVSLCLT